MKKIIALTAITAIVFSACKKDHEKTTLEKLQAKWTFQKEYYHENYSGVEHRDTTNATAGDYADFRTDGKVYTKVGSYADTTSYAIVGDNKVVFIYSSGTDTATINVLTDNELQLYTKEFDPAPDYYEYTDYFSK